ncbi:MAG: FHA domain-containing protein [Microthrixaceae bacterium]|nr:FHA domain-containing protein [Microthrixaceae bacterium]
MSDVTLLLLRIGFLVLLWFFVFAVVYSLRADLFGVRARRLPDAAEAGSQPAPQSQPAAAAPAAPQVVPPGVPVAPPQLAGVVGTAGTGLAGLAAARPEAAGSAAVASVLPGASPASAPAIGGKATTSTVSRIVITSGPKAGLELALGTDPLTIGRSSEAGLVIRDDYTSSHHARLVLWGEQWMVQDLDSTNGTWLGGKRIASPVPVSIGEPIKVGATTFELRK